MRRTLLTLVILFVCMTAKSQLLALKTDALMDVACIPNANLEVVTGNKTSINASVFASWNIYGSKMKTYGVMPEFRYWFSGRAFNRWFMGVGALAAAYDLQIKNKCYEGDAVGGGLTVGYDFWLRKHISIDVHAGMAAVYYEHRRTSRGDNLPIPTSYDKRGIGLVPYQLGVSLVYIIK